MARKRRQGFLDEWLNSGRAPRLEDLSRFAIDNDKWDQQDYERLLDEMEEFNAERDRFCDTVETGNGAWADQYWALQKVDPKLKEGGDMRPEYLVNHAVADETMGLKEWEELRSLGTVGDEVASAMGTITMKPDVEAIFDRLKKEQEQAKAAGDTFSEIEGLEGQGRSIDDMIDALNAQGKGDSREAKDFQKQRELLNKQMQKLKEKLKEQTDEVKKGIESKRPMIRQSMKDALGKAAGEANSLSNMADAWGLDPGQLHRLPASERLQLAKKMNNPKFRKLADLFGPMKRLMFTEQRRKVNHARDEVYDISKGKDLARVLPMQFARLALPETEMLFFKDFVEGNLLQYEMRGEEKVARGGIVFLMDGSGSMGGDREMWAKAVGLCLLHLAKQQKRPFRAVQFGSTYEIKEFDFRRPEDFTIDNITDFAEFFFGGGTDFMRPLSIALDYMKEEFESAGAVKADVVFATDGACGVDETWLKDFKSEQERMKFMVWGISIGGMYGDEPLGTICDKRVFEIRDLANGDDIRQVLGGVGSA